MAEILPIRRKTLSNQLIDPTIKSDGFFLFLFALVIPETWIKMNNFITDIRILLIKI